MSQLDTRRPLASDPGLGSELLETDPERGPLLASKYAGALSDLAGLAQAKASIGASATPAKGSAARLPAHLAEKYPDGLDALEQMRVAAAEQVVNDPSRSFDDQAAALELIVDRRSREVEASREATLQRAKAAVSPMQLLNRSLEIAAEFPNQPEAILTGLKAEGWDPRLATPRLLADVDAMIAQREAGAARAAAAGVTAPDDPGAMAGRRAGAEAAALKSVRAALAEASDAGADFGRGFGGPMTDSAAELQAAMQQTQEERTWVGETFASGVRAVGSMAESSALVLQVAADAIENKGKAGDFARRWAWTNPALRTLQIARAAADKVLPDGAADQADAAIAGAIRSEADKVEAGARIVGGAFARSPSAATGEWFGTPDNPGGWKPNVKEIIADGGEALTSIAAAAGAGIAGTAVGGPVVGLGAGLAVGGGIDVAGMMAGVERDVRQKGASKEDARAIAAGAGLVYAPVSVILERLPLEEYLKKSPAGNLAKSKLIEFVAEKMGDRVAKGLVAASKEGATEVAQEAWGDFSQWAITNDPDAFNEWASRYAKVGVLGAAGGFGIDVAIGAGGRGSELGGKPTGDTPPPPPGDAADLPPAAKRGLMLASDSPAATAEELAESRAERRTRNAEALPAMLDRMSQVAGRQLDLSDPAKLSQEQRAVAELGDQLGVDVVYFDGGEDVAAEASSNRRGLVLVDSQNQGVGAAESLLQHEVVHELRGRLVAVGEAGRWKAIHDAIKSADPEGYASALMDYDAAASEAGLQLDTDTLREEAIAVMAQRAVGGFLRNVPAMSDEKMAAAISRTPRLLERLTDAVQRVLRKLNLWRGPTIMERLRGEASAARIFRELRSAARILRATATAIPLAGPTILDVAPTSDAGLAAGDVPLVDVSRPHELRTDQGVAVELEPAPDAIPLTDSSDIADPGAENFDITRPKIVLRSEDGNIQGQRFVGPPKPRTPLGKQRRPVAGAGERGYRVADDEGTGEGPAGPAGEPAPLPFGDAGGGDGAVPLAPVDDSPAGEVEDSFATQEWAAAKLDRGGSDRSRFLNTRGKLTKDTIRQRLLEMYEDMHGALAAEQELMDSGIGMAWTSFYKRIPTEVMEATEGRPDLRHMMHIVEQSNQAGGEDAIADIGFDRWIHLLELTGQGQGRKAIEFFRESEDLDPESSFWSHVIEILPKGQLNLEFIPAEQVRAGAEFTLGGVKLKTQVRASDGAIIVRPVDERVAGFAPSDTLPAEKPKSGAIKRAKAQGRELDMSKYLPAQAYIVPVEVAALSTGLPTDPGSYTPDMHLADEPWGGKADDAVDLPFALKIKQRLTERVTLADGREIDADPATLTPAFLRWFGDWVNDPASASKVVDEDGRPRVVFHGTWSDFAAFNRLEKAKERRGAKVDTIGSWFTTDPESASQYGPAVVPAYLNIREPMIRQGTGRWETRQEAARGLWRAIEVEGGAEMFRATAKVDGFDGVAIRDDSLDSLAGDVWVAFEPEQIKSINAREFNPGTADMRFSLFGRRGSDANQANDVAGQEGLFGQGTTRTGERQGGLFGNIAAEPKAAPPAAIERREGETDEDFRIRQKFQEAERNTGMLADLETQDDRTPMQRRIDEVMSELNPQTDAERQMAEAAVAKVRRSEMWRMTKDEFVTSRRRNRIRDWQRGIRDAKAMLAGKLPSKKRTELTTNVPFWERQVAAWQEPGSRELIELDRKHGEEWEATVKAAISKGLPVPAEIIASDAAFRAAADARARYEKGRKTSFGNRTVAVNDSMQESRGFKVKRQDGAPITGAQITEISAGVSEVEEAVGSLADLMRHTDLTIAHTSGKYPFMDGSAGGLYHSSERTISIGVVIGPFRQRALAHEIGHWLDFEAGSAVKVKTRILTKSGAARDASAMSEAASRGTIGQDERALIRKAEQSMTDPWRAAQLLRNNPSKAATPEEAELIKSQQYKLTPYWREAREIWARLFEQYVATKRGDGGVSHESPLEYEAAPAWWSKPAFAQLMPDIERVIAVKKDAIRGALGPDLQPVADSAFALRMPKDGARRFSETAAKALADPAFGESIGMPDLANPGRTQGERAVINAADDVRGRPARQAQAGVMDAAQRNLQAQGNDAVRARLLARVRSGGLLDAQETVEAATLAADAAASIIAGGDVNTLKELTTIIAYRQSGTDQARALAIRGQAMEGVERNGFMVAQVLVTPPQRVQAKLDAAHKELREAETDAQRAAAQAKIDALVAQSAASIDRIKGDLQAAGYDHSRFNDPQYVKELMADKAQAARIARIISAAKASTTDKIAEYWRNAILSGPQTQAANAVGNGIYVPYKLLAERAAQAIVGDAGRALGLNVGDLPTLSEYGSMMRAVGPAFSEAAERFISTFQTERATLVDEITGTGLAHEVANAGVAIRGTHGRIVRIPQRLLSATDEWFKTWYTHLDVAGRAWRGAVAEGLQGQARWDRVRDVLGDRTRAEWLRSVDSAVDATFQSSNRATQLGIELRTAIDRRLGPVPVGTFVLPFVTTPVNIGIAAARLSPLSLIEAGYHATTGQWKGNLQLATKDLVRVATAMAIQAILWNLTEPDDDGRPLLTGTRSKARGERDAEYRAMPPMSVRIGDTWMSYARLEPFATLLASSVDAMEAMRERSRDGMGMTENGLQSVLDVGASFGDQLEEKTFLSGLSDLFSVLRPRGDVDPAKRTADYLSRFAVSWVPNLVRQTARATDGELRDLGVRATDERGVVASAVERTAQQALPIGAMGAAPRFDLWGRPISARSLSTPATDFVYRLLVPAKLSGDEPHKLDLMLIRYNQRVPDEQEYWPQEPQRTLTKRLGNGQSHTYRWTDDEYQTLVRDAGEAAARRLSAMRLNFEDPKDRDIKLLRDVVSEERSRVASRLLRERQASGMAVR